MRTRRSSWCRRWQRGPGAARSHRMRQTLRHLLPPVLLWPQPCRSLRLWLARQPPVLLLPACYLQHSLVGFLNSCISATAASCIVWC